eukprot:TRINITY_DN12890_c0_g1_i1.p1 TRINITY_DN12890_c0_g1~~TRINITY_DN12890_c0_g1_i1.p1  ORF type:complete len:311 (+),score=56.45 TRINITY_DN12890_c0_g1_i1:53-985(+)
MAAVIRLRGLPFRATPAEIAAFLASGGVRVTEDNVTIQIGTDGRPSGQGFVVLASEDDASRAQTLDRKTLGSRYVEVHPATMDEIHQPYDNRGKGKGAARGPAGGHGDFVIRPGGYVPAPAPPREALGYVNQGQEGGMDLVVRLRGLPFSATEVDVANFLTGVKIANRGVHMVLLADNRPSGEAFVEVMSREDVHIALARDRQQLGHRYVEVFASSHREMHSENKAAAVVAAAGFWGQHMAGAGGWAAPAAIPPGIPVASPVYTPYGDPGGKGGMTSGQSFKSGDWNCAACGFHNFASRSQCKSCRGHRS